MALGGSTNAVVHLIAIAGTPGDPPDARRFRPHLAPDSVHRQRETVRRISDGGFVSRRRRAGGDEPDRRTCCTGGRHGERQDHAREPRCATRRMTASFARATIRSTPKAASPSCTGTSLPDGAVIKQTAASPHLMQHRGRAYVFETRDQMLTRDRSRRSAGRQGHRAGDAELRTEGRAGFSRMGPHPDATKLLKQGMTDMVRISDARMSGTSFGTVVLHVSPESAMGGPLAIVQTGDEIELDVAARKLELLVSPAEIEARLKNFTPPARTLHTRLRTPVPGPRDPSPPRLRFRFPITTGPRVASPLAEAPMNTTDMLEKIGESLGSSATVRSVFGEPIHAEGKTVVPVAKVAYGFGAGGGHAPGKHNGASGEVKEGGGGGGGVCALPAGALEITQAGTRFVPFTDYRFAAGAFAAGALLGGLLLYRRH